MLQNYLFGLMAVARCLGDRLRAVARAVNMCTKSDTYNKKLLRRNRELAMLNEVARVASRQQDLNVMLDGVLRRVLELMSMAAGWITLMEGDGVTSRLACAVGLPEAVARQEAEAGFLNCQCSRVVEERTPLLITPLVKTCPVYQFRLNNQQIVNGHIVVPLISKSQVLGTLNIACSQSASFSDEDLQLLGGIGRQLGVAVENARLWEKVRQKEVARGRLLEKLITAQEEERKRIARELHDETSQSLTSLMVGLKVLRGLDSSAEIHRHLDSLRDVAAETLETVHDLALELRPSVLDDLGLVAALERHVSEYQRRFNLRVDFRAIGINGQRLPAAIETAVYRIVQETLTNVARHAHADHASVLLEQTGQQLRAIVEDNGCGFDVTQAHPERKLGLYGMAERASLIGGTLRIESQPGIGTTIVVSVSLAEMPPFSDMGLTEKREVSS